MVSRRPPRRTEGDLDSVLVTAEGTGSYARRGQAAIVSAADLRDAVKAYSDALLSGDAAAAFALLSSRCHEAIGESTFSDVVDQAGDLYGNPLPFGIYSADLEGDAAW